MARKICITEKQYKMALAEGILPQSDNNSIEVNAPIVNNNPQQSIKDMENKIQKTGADIKKFKVSVDGNKVQNQNLKGTKIVSNNSDNNSTNTNSVVSENLMITKKQLQENRLKQLKKNSELFTVKDFINKIKK